MTSNNPVDRSSGSGEARTFVGRVKQLTAIVTAFTALVAGMTALVVAGKSGWSEVGPYFSNLFQHGETKIPVVAPIVTTFPPIEPILISNLNDNEHNKREEARTALATAITKASPENVDALVDDISKSPSYRVQLGAAIALAEARGGWPTATKVKSVAVLVTMREKSKDPTLRSALDRAAKAAR